MTKQDSAIVWNKESQLKRVTDENNAIVTIRASIHTRMSLLAKQI